MAFHFRHRSGYTQHHFLKDGGSTPTLSSSKNHKDLIGGWRSRSGAGYTLIEISVVIVITGILLGLILANYRRSNQDSVLQREVSLMMSRIRYAQELTAAGSILRYQGNVYSGASCNSSNECSPHQKSDGTWEIVLKCICCPDNDLSCIHGQETPPGGFAVGFSCVSSIDADGFIQGKTGHDNYYLVADRVKCTGDPPTEEARCWPGIPPAWYNTNNKSDADGIISMWREGTKGDTLKNKYTVDSTVKINDLRVTYVNSFTVISQGNTDSFTCNNKSPWADFDVPGIVKHHPTNTYYDSRIPNLYPIQATVRFLPPDGRTVDVNDNIYSYAPVSTGVADKNNPVKSVEVMLKLKNRDNGCKVVKVERSGTISSYNDELCNFGTP